MAFRSLPGGVPEPRELIGREHLLDILWKQLAGNNIMLIAPRRFGKTGVMNHVLKQPQPGAIPLYFDIEEIDSPEMFATELIHALLQQNKLRAIITGVKGLPKKIFDLITERFDELSIEGYKIKLRDALKEEHWERISRRLILEMEQADEKVIFILDEFPQLVENIARNHGPDTARSFLAWFRSLRMRRKDELCKLRFIIGGSTGIDIILRRLEAPDKLNDFYRLPVGAIDREAAIQLVNGLATGYTLNFTPEAIDTLLDCIGQPIPYFIHLTVSQILIDPGLKGKSLTPEHIQDIYRNRVLGPSCRNYFQYYRERLKRYGEPAERAAIGLLRTISQDGRVSDSALFDIYRKTRKKGASDIEFLEIMADLECDWYVALDPATNEYFFQIDIIRDWWQRYYRAIAPSTRKR